ncbi:MAG: hypothetical protein HY608_10085 [Planctomycetes bacterium]|nr:hypothetical protein [Planctomycetota bacterium]
MPATGTPGMMITGVPTMEGVYVFTVRVTDSLGYTATREFTMTVKPSKTVTSGAAAE